MTSIVQSYQTIPKLTSLLGCGDRFISQRTGGGEMFNSFDTKSEIFSQNSQINLLDKLGSHTSQ